MCIDGEGSIKAGVGVGGWGALAPVLIYIHVYCGMHLLAVYKCCCGRLLDHPLHMWPLRQ